MAADGEDFRSHTILFPEGSLFFSRGTRRVVPKSTPRERERERERNGSVENANGSRTKRAVASEHRQLPLPRRGAPALAVRRPGPALCPEESRDESRGEDDRVERPTRTSILDATTDDFRRVVPHNEKMPLSFRSRRVREETRALAFSRARSTQARRWRRRRRALARGAAAAHRRVHARASRPSPSPHISPRAPLKTMIPRDGRETRGNRLKEIAPRTPKTYFFKITLPPCARVRGVENPRVCVRVFARAFQATSSSISS